MPRILIFFVGVVLVLPSLQAQNSLYVGLRGDFHASTATVSHTIFGTSVPTFEKYGAGGGVMVKFFPKPHYGLQLEINYTPKSFDQILTDTNEVFETTFNYIEIPFMFNLYLGKRKTQYFVNFGPNIAILSGHEISGPSNSASERLDYLFDEDRDNKTIFGIKLAGGIFREFSFGGIHLDGFLTADIGNFLEPVDLSTGVPDNSQNFVFGVSLAYLVPIGKSFEVTE